MGVEFELKFRATPEQQNQIRECVAGAERVISMQTTYYDTPTGALSARRYTLRCRMENDTAVCTLKTPAAGNARNEWEINCESIEKAIPELCKLSDIQELPALLAEGVVPVCGAAFTRIAKNITLPGAEVELALDRGVLTGGEKEMPLCEVEIELKSGSREVAAMYAAQLAVAYGLQQEASSKFRRGLALAKGEHHG